MIGKVLGNRYEIIEKIGEGGMAKVYKAKCRLLNRFVAVKILKDEYVDDNDFIVKFNRESQSAAKLSHPNIVNIYDVGDFERTHYIVMEWVEGSTLKELIKEEGVFEPERILDIASQIAQALNHAHKNRIIHRDIKPQNILLTREGRIKVADFGIARAMTDATAINTTNLMGSVHYASPEQLKGSLVDERADLYSLGVIMYEMATGGLPYEGDGPVAVALKHMNEPLIPPSLVNSDIPKGLEHIIMKAMEKTAAYRYETAEAFLEDLALAATDSSDSWTKTQDRERTMALPVIGRKGKGVGKKPVKRKKRGTRKSAVVAAVASALVLSVVFIASATYFLLRDDFFNQEVSVPDLTGIAFEEATGRLEALNLDYVVYEERYDRYVAKGSVILQDPEALELVKEGYTVKLTVSLGMKKTKVPNLLNLSQKEAEIILDNHNLLQGDTEYVYSDLPVDTVMGQSPSAGSMVDEMTAVTLVLSQGRQVQAFIMPNLVETPLSYAKGNLSDLGLGQGRVTYQMSETVEKDYVIAQSVAPGTEVSGGTVIDLTVSSGMPQTENPTRKTLFIPLSFDQDAADVRVVSVIDGERTVVFEDRLDKSENSLSLELEGRGAVLVEVYFDGELAFSKEEIFE